MVKTSVVVPHAIGAETIEEGIALAAEAGADGVEIYDLDGPEPEEVRGVADDHDVEIAAILAQGEAPGIEAVDPAISNPDSVEQSVSDLTRSIDAAVTVGAHGLVVTVGQRQDRFAPHEQHGAMLEVFRRVAPVAEDAGIVLLPEMLNRRVDHPGYLLETASDGYRLIQAVDSPAVKVLFDVYHQQITEGNIVDNLRRNVEYIGHLHVADVPGRGPPGTGELAYETVFEVLNELDFDGFVGCEFSPGDDGVETVAETVAMARSA